MLSPPCWGTEQKDAVWFQLRGQGAGLDGRRETPFLSLLRACGFMWPLSSSLPPMVIYGDSQRTVGLGDPMNLGLNTDDPFPGFATIEKAPNRRRPWPLPCNNEGIMSIKHGSFEE